MALWPDRLARVRASVDRELADPITARPQRVSQYGGSSPDPDRAAFDLAGVLLVGEGGQADLAGGNTGTWLARIPVGEAELQIDPDAHPQARNLRKGDLIVAEQRSGAVYEIARVEPPRRNRIVLRLAAQ
ncbi:hypothetical protein [Bosea sp. (in: a-proteobacteria)]|uniref:hypothetical protein n=1 Tax=Bosea sp. (in: a-proteobacteria) TaxID=1871050 RepID=UPI001AD0A49E|nr:hypothetical protein [Bosea sp. (in: a-proteobacteria)]MBN9443680.1 hypothetical protein [Bosea sp. (in: a-proteobacteria)]